MQVDVHGIDAEIARLRLAHDGVEVGAVAVEIGARIVDRLGDLRHLRLEQAAGVGVREHDRSHVRPETLLHVLHMHPAVLAGRHRLHLEADEGGGGGVRAVRRIGHEHHVAGRALALGLDGSLDRHHAAELAMGTGLRRERHGGHVGERDEIAAEFVHQLQRALHGGDRLQRMHVGEAGQTRHALVEARIVLHGAGAERKEARVDAVVLL
ncbi:MAG: hypothetical protein K0R61_3721 [Microvirga sp.]|nr:hypothetical protein [Microvirga sp.]